MEFKENRYEKGNSKHTWTPNCFSRARRLLEVSPCARRPRVGLNHRRTVQTTRRHAISHRRIQFVSPHLTWCLDRSESHQRLFLVGRDISYPSIPCFMCLFDDVLDWISLRNQEQTLRCHRSVVASMAETSKKSLIHSIMSSRKRTKKSKISKGDSVKTNRMRLWRKLLDNLQL